MPKYFEEQYGGSYLGLNTEKPAIYLDPAETPSVSNFWFRNSELRSRPNFKQVFLGPEALAPSQSQTSFTDANGNIHTCSFTPRGLWQLNPSNSVPELRPWTYIGGQTLNAGTPVAARAFANLLYYTNGVPYLQSWDGIANSPVVVSGLTNSIYGGTGSTVGGVFLFEINFQLCLLNVTLFNAAAVGSTPAGSTTNFPQRIWYSANGVPSQFDPTVNTSAGFVDFLDVPDQFTGAMAIGEIAYLFRSNGVTQMTIAGNSLAPFYFDHMWASERGIGNVYPYSIAQYGSVGVFISTEQVYLLSINSFQEIGGGSRDNIMRDLALASAPPVAAIISTLGGGFIYLTYHLLIPMKTFTRGYMYSIEDKNWTVNDFPGIIVTGPPSTVYR